MINCTQCEHYYITWDKNFPHGCRALGFKSAQLPCTTVRISSNQECLFFKKKTRRKK
ncbi:MAG: uracil-DNA glycosylase [Deltaproteobacteria bacterium]|nr:uracil-DNA glycosylase [Deltaproteobacteria bacterium]